MRDQLSEALEKFQKDGPYTMRMPSPPDDVVSEMLDDMDSEGLFDVAGITIDTVFQGSTEALVKVTAEDGEVVYVSVNDEEFQDQDEYKITAYVEDNPAEWLDKQAASLHEQAASLMSEAESAEMQAALLRGKTVKYAEKGDDDVVTVYVTDDEFLAHYREWYEDELTWGERNPPAEEYLAKVKAGEVEPVENHYYVKMTAEWLGGGND